MGMDWWTREPNFSSRLTAPDPQAELDELRQRLARLESRTGDGLAPETISPAALTGRSPND